MNSAPVFRDLVSALDQAGISYMVVGSFASNLFGDSRGTQDIDILVSANPEQIRTLLDAFPKTQYYFDLNTALEACRHKSMFNILDMERGWKIDVIFQKPGAYHEQAFRRRSAAQIDGVDVIALTPEDVIISKLLWAKMGESSLQIGDVAGVLKVQQSSLDFPYIEKWVHELGLESQWNEARRQANLE
jgi:predicted nucleotidyltransferase